jgi:hypothetical protein
MKSGLTYIIFVIDRSGSMSSIRTDMIGGFNAFIKAQRDANIGECRVFAYQFDTEYSTIFENLNINDVPNLTEKTYQPRGGTALYNSLGKTVVDIGTRLASLPESERPEKVLVVTITDGEDNSELRNFSVSEYDSSKVKEMVKHQTEAYKWDFAYIGANQDAWAVGATMGVTNNLNYVADSVGTARAFGNLTKSTLSYRSAPVASAFAFTNDDTEKTP